MLYGTMGEAKEQTNWVKRKLEKKMQSRRLYAVKRDYHETAYLWEVIGQGPRGV